MQPLLLLVLLLVLSFPALSGCAEHGPLQRIVSLGPINTENVFLLGAGDRLVGSTIYCTRPEAARQTAKVGSVMEISVERVLSLNPELVLATSLTPPKLVDTLRSLGLRVVQFRQAETFADLCVQVQQLGVLLHREEEAERIVTEAHKRVDIITRNVAGLPAQKVFLQIGTRPLFASTPGSFTNDYIRLGNGINIAGQQQSGLIGYEKVLARDPDVILLALMDDASGVAAREMKKWQAFTSLTAVRTKRIHLLDPDLVCSPSPLTFARSWKRWQLSFIRNVDTSLRKHYAKEENPARYLLCLGSVHSWLGNCCYHQPRGLCCYVWRHPGGASRPGSRSVSRSNSYRGWSRVSANHQGCHSAD